MKPEIFISVEKDLDAIIRLHKSVLPHLKWSYSRKYVLDMLNSYGLEVCRSVGRLR